MGFHLGMGASGDEPAEVLAAKKAYLLARRAWLDRAIEAIDERLRGADAKAGRCHQHDGEPHVKQADCDQGPEQESCEE
jgi:hypothetical protein